MLCLDGLPIPLSAYRQLDTDNADALNCALSRDFHNGYADIKRKTSFRIVYNMVNLGEVSLHAAAASSSFVIHADHAEDSFALVYLSCGNFEILSGKGRKQGVPGKTGILLNFDTPSTLAVHPYYNNITVRFTRSATEAMLRRACGVPLRHHLTFANVVDLTQPSTKRLLGIINHVIDMVDSEPGLPLAPLLVAQYEQLLLTALLTSLDHNAAHLLRAPAQPAPPKVVSLCEAYIESNADKPLRLTDLAELTGLSVRSVQLAFKKHRDYTPSQFLRECRLARARDMLQKSEPDTTILSVALACGFASQGLFARLYRRRFGETPSETSGKQKS